jgi:mono/diheme cytochrome c family protein
MIRPVTALFSALLTSVTASIGMVALAQQPSSGKIIPSYYVDVQPILEKNCNSCHTAGGIAPFALDNPKDAVQWAKRITQVTKSEYMPPYPPGRDSQRFLDERRLGATSKQILEDWANAGAPLGKTPRK